MTSVLVLGDIPSTGIVGTTAERVVLKPPHASRRNDHAAEALPAAPGRAGSLEVFLDLVARRLHRADFVLAVYPAWRSDPATRYVQFARSALESERIVGVPTSLPPLALSVVADQLAYLAPYVPPGVLVGLTTRLAHETLAGAWVRSVARLEHVSTSLAQHLRSYLPGGFVVTSSPRQAVHRVTGRAPVGDFHFRPADPLQVLAAHRDGDTAWFQEKLLPSVRPARVQLFQPQPFGDAYWGTRKYLEYVAFSSHPQALTYAAGSIRVRRCRWCDQVVATSTCPFCGMTRHRVGQPAPTDPRDATQEVSRHTAAPQNPAAHLGNSSSAYPASPNHADGGTFWSGPARSSGPAPPVQAAGSLPSPTEPGSGVP